MTPIPASFTMMLMVPVVAWPSNFAQLTGGTVLSSGDFEVI